MIGEVWSVMEAYYSTSNSLWSPYRLHSGPNSDQAEGFSYVLLICCR